MKKKLALCFALAAIMIFAMTGCLQLEVVEASIQIDELPKTTYYVGESMPSFSVKLIENEAITKVITSENELLTVSGFSTENVGKFEAKVSYQYSSSKILSFTFEYTVTDGLQYGSGTMLDPYQLYTASDLMQAIKDNQGAYKYYRLENNLDFAGVDMAAYNAAVAGTTFAGTLDGNGFQIASFRNIVTNPAKASDDKTTNGIFYKLGNFVAKDLTLFNCQVENAVGKGVGILAWGSEDGSVSLTIDNVNTRGNSYASGAANVGGLLGYARVKALTIKNSSNVADVKGQGNGAGGFAGTTGTTGSTIVVIENSENSGDISGANYVGGMTGNGCNQTIFNIKNVANSGDIMASSPVHYNTAASKPVKYITVGAIIGGGSGLTVEESTEEYVLEGSYTNTGKIFVAKDPEAEAKASGNYYMEMDAQAIHEMQELNVAWAADGKLSITAVENASKYIITTYAYVNTVKKETETSTSGGVFNLIDQETVNSVAEVTTAKYAMIFAACGAGTEDYAIRTAAGWKEYFSTTDYENKNTVQLNTTPAAGEIKLIASKAGTSNVKVTISAVDANGNVVAMSTISYALETLPA